MDRKRQEINSKSSQREDASGGCDEYRPGREKVEFGKMAVLSCIRADKYRKERSFMFAGARFFVAAHLSRVGGRSEGARKCIHYK